MPEPYVSNSSFSLWNKDRTAWYLQYMVAREERKGEKMTLGKIFQEAWCDKKYDYVKELKKHGFTSDKARAIKNALSHPRTIRLPKGKTEKEILVKGRGLLWPILAKLDGADTEANLIVENKWGKKWTQKRVDTGIYHDENAVQRVDYQITWYILAYYLKYRKIPRFVLQSFNEKNGIPEQLWAKRYQFDLDRLILEINKMVMAVQQCKFI